MQVAAEVLVCDGLNARLNAMGVLSIRVVRDVSAFSNAKEQEGGTDQNAELVNGGANDGNGHRVVDASGRRLHCELANLGS